MKTVESEFDLRLSNLLAPPSLLNTALMGDEVPLTGSITASPEVAPVEPESTAELLSDCWEAVAELILVGLVWGCIFRYFLTLAEGAVSVSWADGEPVDGVGPGETVPLVRALGDDCLTAGLLVGLLRTTRLLEFRRTTKQGCGY